MDEKIKYENVKKAADEVFKSEVIVGQGDPNLWIDTIRAITGKDVVEVVRCKDCVSSEMYEFGCSGVKRLACVEKEDGVVRFAQAVDPMGYCSGGKRKEGERE